MRCWTARGYALIDEVVLYNAPIDLLTDLPIPPVTCFHIWEPLAIMVEIWASGGVGPERLDVMGRAQTKTGFLRAGMRNLQAWLLLRLMESVAMVHAVEVLEHQRKQGVAEWMMRAAAIWAAKQGATQIAVLCVTANKPANALYTKLGFTRAGTYHYRQAPE